MCKNNKYYELSYWKIISSHIHMRSFRIISSFFQSISIYIHHSSNNHIVCLRPLHIFNKKIKPKKISQRQWLSCHGPCVHLPAIWRFLPVPSAQSLGFHAPRVLRHVAAVLVWWPCCPSLRHVPRRGSRNFQRPWKWKKLGKNMAEIVGRFFFCFPVVSMLLVLCSHHPAYFWF